MTSLGDLSGPVYDITTIHTFKWFGDTIRVHPDLSPLAIIDIAEKLAEAEGSEGVAQISVIKLMFRSTVHPEDFQKFWDTAKVQRYTIEQLMEVQQKIVAGVTQRPTSQPSDSSGGQRNIITSSVVERDEPVSPLTAMDQRVADREMEGRPDLRLALLNQAERRVG